ncbi:MAG: hypothetical protein ACXADB_11570 [Candidatus Hermodarchaeia archaeon]|jgi:beta-glucosidase/6-phospho-beta-glucosidase/beta-galactosidase
MNQTLAYEYGKEVGYGIGLENAADFTDFDKYMEDCTTHESDGFRQFSPFEFYAKEMNETANPDATWEKYEKGVRVGLRKAWREYND